MGTRYINQGECHVCRKLTHDYCDHCFKYICEEHRFYKRPEHGRKEFIFCKECFEKKKKPIDPAQKPI